MLPLLVECNRLLVFSTPSRRSLSSTDLFVHLDALEPRRTKCQLSTEQYTNIECRFHCFKLQINGKKGNINANSETTQINSVDQLIQYSFSENKKSYFDISEQEKVSMQKNVIAEDVDDFIGRMTSMGKSQMMADHDNMHRKQRHIFSFTENLMKNRYKNIVLFDEGAVILSTGKRDKSSDTYIHATNIKTKFGNYVLAQSPKPETLNDWYRMIWQLNIAVIVCLIPLSTKEDCAKYFERKVGKKLKHKRFTIRTMTTRREEDCNIYELKFSNKDFKEDDRMIHLINFTKWKIIVRPPEPRKFLAMMRSVWATEASANSVGDDKTSSPTLVHGVTGTRRTGTYVIMSMLCRQMSEHHQISLLKVCSRVRHFRYSVMRNRICFTVLLESVLVFAADQGLVDRSNVDFQNAIKNIRNAVTIEEQ